MSRSPDEAIEVQRLSEPGLDVDHFFLDRAFTAFQAVAQSTSVVTFSAASAYGRASLTFAGKNGVWTNPVTGAFGGAALSEPSAAAMASALVAEVTAWLRREPAATTATFRLPPDCFPDPAASVVENALFNNGWHLASVDLDQFLPVSSPEAFTSGLGETRKKEIRRLRRSGAEVRLKTVDEAEPAYAAIAHNRAGRGFPMTMSWEQVQALARRFPDRVAFHAVERAGETLAGAVTLTVTRRYAYVFYWGEDPKFRREAPIVLLAEGLMARSHTAGLDILDIGISSEASRLNSGLFAFKESLGCRVAAKRTYRIDLTNGV